MRNNVARAVIVALATHLGLDRAEEEVLGLLTLYLHFPVACCVSVRSPAPVRSCPPVRACPGCCEGKRC